MIRIKPHHYMDMIKLYGSGLDEFLPDEVYGHDFYRVGNEILRDPHVELQFVLGCDQVCSSCKFKGSDDRCQDTVTNLPGYTSKDAYNRMIDQRLVDLLGLDLGRTYTSQEYCRLLYANKNLVFHVWTVEDPAVTQRRDELFRRGCRRYLQGAAGL